MAFGCQRFLCSAVVALRHHLTHTLYKLAPAFLLAVNSCHLERITCVLPANKLTNPPPTPCLTTPIVHPSPLWAVCLSFMLPGYMPTQVVVCLKKHVLICVQACVQPKCNKRNKRVWQCGGVQLSLSCPRRWFVGGQQQIAPAPSHNPNTHNKANKGAHCSHTRSSCQETIWCVRPHRCLSALQLAGGPHLTQNRAQQLSQFSRSNPARKYKSLSQCLLATLCAHATRRRNPTYNLQQVLYHPRARQHHHRKGEVEQK